MQEFISVRGAKEHNLKNISVDIPRNQLVVITGPSGSGKSSLAFDTIYAEGQRRYVESLSAYARQFLEMQDKPDVESITGLSPAIAIDQRTTSRNPRSTVATVTEIYDYMRLLYARIGVPYSPATGQPIEKQSVTQMADRIRAFPEGTKINLLAPIVRGAKGEHKKELESLKKSGFTRVRIDGKIYEFDEIPEINKNQKHEIEVVVDRLAIQPEIGNRLPSSIETALKLGEGLIYVEIVALPEDAPEKSPEAGEIIMLSENFSCPVSGFQIAEIEPRLFSFNSPYGACPACDGLGSEMYFDQDLIVPDPSLSLSDGAIAAWSNPPSSYARQTFDSLASAFAFDTRTPWSQLPEKVRDVILNGSGNKSIEFQYDDGYRSYKASKPFEGVVPNLERRYKESESNKIREDLERFQTFSECRACSGHRLKQEALCVKLDGRHIGEICQMTIEDALAWVKNLPVSLTETQKSISARVLQEITRRIGFLNNVGLDYLTLARRSGTLSGGESQRIRLASQIGAGLTGVLYVLDEPSIGLHQSDNAKLIKTLQNLRDIGNTVLVVEHDEETMVSADYLIDVGPGAGVHGGNIVAQGTPDQVMEDKNSITGQYLSGKKYIAVPERRKLDMDRSISIIGARTNNLKNVSVDIPLRSFCAVTGVSGGGKSSLILHTLNKALSKSLNGTKANPGEHDRIDGIEFVDKVIQIDQSPIGRTPRSNPATYTGAFSHIRDWFVGLPEAKARGYKAGRFSFNVKGGRCETCQGDGMLKIEMHFLPDVYVVCDACKGARYNKETLEVRYKDKSIADVLEMTVEESLEFFHKMPQIRDKIHALNEVGLGYIKLGQSATTLSGGEAQRIKLARELSRRSTGRTIYILDEPTTGLHSDDIAKLLKVLHSFVDTGNTVLVIEHNLDVIKTADWVIDIGPGGGSKGGNVIGTGTPEDIVKIKESQTGKFLKPLLDKGKKAKKAA